MSICTTFPAWLCALGAVGSNVGPRTFMLIVWARWKFVTKMNNFFPMWEVRKNRRPGSPSSVDGFYVSRLRKLQFFFKYKNAQFLPNVGSLTKSAPAAGFKPLQDASYFGKWLAGSTQLFEICRSRLVSVKLDTSEKSYGPKLLTLIFLTRKTSFKNVSGHTLWNASDFIRSRSSRAL